MASAFALERSASLRSESTILSKSGLQYRSLFALFQFEALPFTCLHVQSLKNPAMSGGPALFANSSMSAKNLAYPSGAVFVKKTPASTDFNVTLKPIFSQFALLTTCFFCRTGLTVASQLTPRL